MKKKTWINLGFQVGALVLALLITTFILVAAGAPPFKAYASILNGAFGSISNVGNDPDHLVAVAADDRRGADHLFRRSVEHRHGRPDDPGCHLRHRGAAPAAGYQLPPALIIILGILAGIVGGALWAALAGALKTFGGVNEIFGGLGLNFVATALTIYLVFGPWKRPGVGSMSGTQPFDQKLMAADPARYATEPLGTRDCPSWSLYVVYFLLRGTHFGLRLKAVGKNPKAAFLMGVPTWQYSMFAFLLCGAFAGLAGAIQVTSVYHRLLPNISNGYGFLGLLVAMLINYQAIWAAPIAFFFAALNIGSVQLQIQYKLDSSFAVSCRICWS